MRPRVLIIDHHDSYTWNLVHLFAQVCGEEPVVLQHDRTTAAEIEDAAFTHVVLSPGPGHPARVADFQVGREILLDAKVPVLGICLGMQGMATTYGGAVAEVEPAHGAVQQLRHQGHAMFKDVPPTFTAVRYHSLAVIDLPAAFEATAWCEGSDGDVLMAIAHRRKPLWGVQYHPESILTQHGPSLARAFLALSA